jgi:hypothetical protein
MLRDVYLLDSDDRVATLDSLLQHMLEGQPCLRAQFAAFARVEIEHRE